MTDSSGDSDSGYWLSMISDTDVVIALLDLKKEIKDQLSAKKTKTYLAYCSFDSTESLHDNIRKIHTVLGHGFNDTVAKDVLVAIQGCTAQDVSLLSKEDFNNIIGFTHSKLNKAKITMEQEILAFQATIEELTSQLSGLLNDPKFTSKIEFIRDLSQVDAVNHVSHSHDVDNVLAFMKCQVVYMENSKLGISPSEQHTSEHKAEQEFESSLDGLLRAQLDACGDDEDSLSLDKDKQEYSGFSNMKSSAQLVGSKGSQIHPRLSNNIKALLAEIQKQKERLRDKLSIAAVGAENREDEDPAHTMYHSATHSAMNKHKPMVQVGHYKTKMSSLLEDHQDDLDDIFGSCASKFEQINSQVVADCDPKRAEIYDKMDQVLLRSTSDGLKDLKKRGETNVHQYHSMNKLLVDRNRKKRMSFGELKASGNDSRSLFGNWETGSHYQPPTNPIDAIKQPSNLVRIPMKTFIMDTYTRAHVLEAAAHRDATDIFETKLKETYAQLKAESAAKMSKCNQLIHRLEERHVDQVANLRGNALNGVFDAVEENERAESEALSGDVGLSENSLHSTEGRAADDAAVQSTPVCDDLPFPSSLPTQDMDRTLPPPAPSPAPAVSSKKSTMSALFNFGGAVEEDTFTASDDGVSDVKKRVQELDEVSNRSLPPSPDRKAGTDTLDEVNDPTPPSALFSTTSTTTASNPSSGSTAPKPLSSAMGLFTFQENDGDDEDEDGF